MFVGQRSGRRKKLEVKSTRGPSAEPGCVQLGRSRRGPRGSPSWSSRSGQDFLLNRTNRM